MDGPGAPSRNAVAGRLADRHGAPWQDLAPHFPRPGTCRLGMGRSARRGPPSQAVIPLPDDPVLIRPGETDCPGKTAADQQGVAVTHGRQAPSCAEFAQRGRPQ